MSRASDAWSEVDVGSPSRLSGYLSRSADANLPRTLLGAAAVALTYAAAAWFGTAFSFPGARVSALWFPNAILLAALLLAQRRDWWIYLAAALPVHFLVLLLLGVPTGRVLIGYL